MKALRHTLVLGLALLCVSKSSAHPPAPPARRAAAQVDPAAEALIHTAKGFPNEGQPQLIPADRAANLRVTIVDKATGKPTFCRVNVVGPDGNFYEPTENQLAPWSLHRLGNRQGKGPFRYYGWFFYTSGEFTVDVPPGATRIEVWKGYEYRPITHELTTTKGANAPLKLELERTASLAEAGYYSGDIHIHLSRTSETDDQRIFDLLEAEDIQFGTLLSHNDGKTYGGMVERQLHPQARGFGAAAIVERGPYAIASGQEYVTASYGHILLFLHQRLVMSGMTNDPNRWPLLGLLGEETRKLGGYSFHAHGGYANEIYIDFAQRATDGVELLQFAEYRGIALEGWYRMLNIGSRFPAVGASDYPFCRMLGDCRTYVYSPARPTFPDWSRRAADGRSFFTTGPLLLLEVDGARPGDTIRRKSGESQPVKARLRVRSEVAPITQVEFVVNGQSTGAKAMPTDAAGRWVEFEEAIPVNGPLWIAARCSSMSPPGRPDAEAHTNPIYLTIDGKLPYATADVDWLIARIDELITALDKRKFEEKPMALEFYRKSRAKLVAIREAGGQKE